MARKSTRAALILTEEELGHLEELRQSRKASVREAQRAHVLCRYHGGESVSQIARAVRMTRKSVLKWIDKALAMGVDAGLRDTPHRPRGPAITGEAKAWVVHLACTQPKDLGYAAELWTRSALAAHVRLHAVAQGHPSLARAAKATVHRILRDNKLRPHKVTYYLERRDPDFEPKMREVLLVYREVWAQNEIVGAGGERPPVITVAVDEKPGVQAIANTAPDLPPVAGRHPTLARDHEYKRLGTLSLLAALDLHDGHVTACVEKRHRSIEFIGLLKLPDNRYPPESTIRLVLDNHSSHISRETRAYLATRPNRFKYVLTPTHGSWLNLAETLFGKAARTFLKDIRVTSLEDLRERILKGIDEINQAPVVHRWGKFDSLDQ